MLVPDDFQIQTQECRELFNLAEDMADTQGAMVGWPLGTPSVDERRRLKTEAQAAIRIADLQPLAAQRYAFRGFFASGSVGLSSLMSKIPRTSSCLLLISDSATEFTRSSRSHISRISRWVPSWP